MNQVFKIVVFAVIFTVGIESRWLQKKFDNSTGVTTEEPTENGTTRAPPNATGSEKTWLTGPSENITTRAPPNTTEG